MSQRVPCPPPAASPCARPRSLCSLSLPAAGFFLRSAARVPCAAYPCLTPVLCAASSCAPPPASPVRPIPARRGFCPPPVLPALRGKGGYWQGASACLRAASPCARPPASRALRRPRSPCGLSLRPPASPVRPIPARRGFCPSAAGKADIGRDTAPARPRPPRGLTQRAAGSARRVALRAAARVLRTALSLRAAGFVRPPRERRILAGSQRVPCPPRHPARPPASSARPNPARRGFCPPRYPARRRPRPLCGLTLRARPRLLCGLSLRAAGSARLQFCLRSAGRADIGSEPARTVPAASPCAPARVLRAA